MVDFMLANGFHRLQLFIPLNSWWKITKNKELLADFNWIVLPVVNADGYEYTQISDKTRWWRKTRKPFFYKGDQTDTWEDLHEVAMAGAEAIYQSTGTNYTVGSSTTILYVAAGKVMIMLLMLAFPHHLQWNFLVRGQRVSIRQLKD
ncbi:hypothetical protein EVAR_71877_1 [Eumeta japonica]|uniref:Peptidase M14 domain-containing protein n=1 Tax=Eumeta variegata TaxID=151549 RepID=A0A4C1SPX9_EUMVA|nr:hypothetical protein EVAR_71877_1 [Eumeta japonica]